MLWDNNLWEHQAKELLKMMKNNLTILTLDISQNYVKKTMIDELKQLCERNHKFQLQHQLPQMKVELQSLMKKDNRMIRKLTDEKVHRGTYQALLQDLHWS